MEDLNLLRAEYTRIAAATFILLFLALAAYGQQQERIAIINTVDDRDSIGFSELAYLTDRLRETVNTLVFLGNEKKERRRK